MSLRPRLCPNKSDCKSMLAFSSLSVELLGLAIVFISVMACMTGRRRRVTDAPFRQLGRGLLNPMPSGWLTPEDPTAAMRVTTPPPGV
jgi:hypothetical protein